MIHIRAEKERMYVEYLYDLADQELEMQVIQAYQDVRQGFGEQKEACFKVLSRDERCFFTEKIATGQIETLDVDSHYNDDFAPVNHCIQASMQQEISGLILLHGKPGTGKTSYIKNLIHSYPKTEFIFVQNEFVQELLKPQFISFLLKNRNSVLIIEDAEKVVMSREYAGEDSVVSTILQLTD
ncbi:MAG: AAA family ATPase, partial [Bacteroidota bacterium]